jgi:hypothetical protein
VSVKYLVLILRADNRGEGGILALMALAVPPATERRGSYTLLLHGHGAVAGEAIRIHGHERRQGDRKFYRIPPAQVLEVGGHIEL